MLGVYFPHTEPHALELMKNRFDFICAIENMGVIVAYIFAIALVIFCTGTVVDRIRNSIFIGLEEIYKTIRQKRLEGF